MNMPDNTGLPARSGGLVVPHKSRSSQYIIAWLVFLAEKFVTASLRRKWRGHSGLAEAQDGQPVIFCLWHKRLAISMVVHRRHGSSRHW